jgi:hypothetical protein
MRAKLMMEINNSFIRRVASLFFFFVLTAAALVPAYSQTRRPPLGPRHPFPAVKATPPEGTTARYYTIRANNVVRVRINERISSGSAKVGDSFKTTVVHPVYVNGAEVIPQGSIIEGRITNVNRASRRSQAGSIGVGFVALRLPSGYSRAFNGSLASLSSESSKVDNEGEVSGRSSAERNVVFVGGGAATGALIGAIANGGKGAGIGAGVGAGIGAAGALFAKGKEAVVEPGTTFGVMLNQSISLPEVKRR